MPSDTSSSAALPHDPLWPRSSEWLGPARSDLGVERFDVAVIGVPTWRTSISPTGAGATPDAIRSALARYSTYAHGLDLASLRAVDVGNIDDPDGDDGEQRVRDALAALRGRAELVIALGGDNSATFSVALGAYGDGLASGGLVTLDAHHDVRDGVSNGSPVRRLVEAGLDPRRVAQVGISDFANSPAYAQRVRDHGITVIGRSDVAEKGIEDAVARALDVAGSAGGSIHVDIDVDVCDRSVAPGCPASVPGGITADELRRAAFVVGRDHRVGSVDIVEVDAAADTPDGRTVRLAALCVLEVSAGLASRPAAV